MILKNVLLFFIVSTVYHGILGVRNQHDRQFYCSVSLLQVVTWKKKHLIVERQAKYQKQTLIFDSNIASKEEDTAATDWR